MQRLDSNTTAESLGMLRADTYAPRPAYHCVLSKNYVRSLIMSSLDAASVRRADPSGQLKPCLLLTAVVHDRKRSTIGMKFDLAEARRLATDMLALCEAIESGSDIPAGEADKKAI